MSYLFDGLWAIDPVNPANVALNAEVVIFDPADAGHSPIPLTDGDGFALPNPLTTNEKGFVGAFRADLDRVGWEAAGLTGYITSYDGLKGAAEAAAASAADASAASLAASGNAAEAAVAAQQAATLVNSPADDVVAMLVGGAGSQTQSATDTRYSKRGEAVLLVPDYAVGDGITDDTAAIQTVFSIAAQFGHIVDFGSSEHTYYMAGVVEVGSNTVVQGRGATLIKKTVAGESSYAFFCTRSHGSAFYGAGGSSIRFNNMKFRGTFPDRPACAFSGHHSDDVQFHGCTFEQMAGTGHVVDLSGCQDVVFRDCRFIGATDVNSRAEAIQIDISARGAISVLDDDGSYSGMPTRRVTVDNCKFLPLTLDGVTYPAPVPMGSHAQWEGKWF